MPWPPIFTGLSLFLTTQLRPSSCCFTPPVSFLAYTECPLPGPPAFVECWRKTAIRLLAFWWLWTAPPSTWRQRMWCLNVKQPTLVLGVCSSCSLLGPSVAFVGAVSSTRSLVPPTCLCTLKHIVMPHQSCLPLSSTVALRFTIKNLFRGSPISFSPEFPLLSMCMHIMLSQYLVLLMATWEANSFLLPLKSWWYDLPWKVSYE